MEALINMKVKLEDRIQHFRTVWMEGDVVKMIDQPKIPHSFEILDLHDYKETGMAIRNMNTRGAGAIGGTAGYAMAQAVLHAPKDNYESLVEYVEEAADYIRSMRPTAQNLFYAVDKVLDSVYASKNPKSAIKSAPSPSAVSIAESAVNQADIK